MTNGEGDTMDGHKRGSLETDGWRLGNAQDFLGLTDEEARVIDLRVNLGRIIRRRRLAKGLTQEELAGRLKTGQARVARIELGLTGVSLDQMFRALFVLGGGFADLQVPAAPAIEPVASPPKRVRASSTTKAGRKAKPVSAR